MSDISSKTTADISTPNTENSEAVKKSNDTNAAISTGENPPISISFELDDSSSELIAVIAESQTETPITFASINERLNEDGFASYDIKNNVISDLVQKAESRTLGRFPIAPKKEYTQINFLLDEESGNIEAKLTPSDKEVITERTWIRDEIERLGYANCYFEPGILDKLFTLVTKNDRGSYLIGQKRDAEITIEFDEDFMVAFISIGPPQGGEELSEPLLIKALNEADIYLDCCDEPLLEKILLDKAADRQIFARGSEPVDGVDASFEPLVQEVEYSTPKETKTGKIDLLDIVNFTLVDANTPLMKRTPAIQGTNGRNVKGQVIPAEEAVDTPFDPELPGATASEDDPNVLVSTCKGHPVILPHGVRVDNTIVVNNVDMSTGHIDYDGSVLIKGEVRPGMKVKATGDIIVKGVVSKASLQAKNNITVECGIIGTEPSEEGENSPPAIIKAGGNLSAQYANLVRINAGRDIYIREYLSHCTTEAKHQVHAGQKGGKGRIFGGTCYAQSGIFACSLGANGGVKTLLLAGTPIEQLNKFKQLEKNYDHRVQQSNQLKKAIKKAKAALADNPQDIVTMKKAAAAQKMLTEISIEISKMEKTIMQINHLFKESKSAQVSVSKSTFPNVEIAINGAEFSIRQESKGGIFVKQGKDIRWKNYESQ